MRKILLAITIASLAAISVIASDQADVMKVVNQFVDGFNKGDVKSAVAACASETSIIDEFSPHEWHGAGACQNWYNDFDADAKKNGITDGVVTLGKARHIDVSGDRAYVVVPTTFSYKQNGKPVKETGSLMTVVLKRNDGAWQIIGWSWSRG